MNGPARRAIASHVDPAIQLHRVGRLDQATAADPRIYTLVFWMATAFTGVSLLLSLVGVHAVFSFITTRRTREVGIRIALGGRPRHVAAALFRRPAIQIGLGIAIGLWIAVGLGAGDKVPRQFVAFVAVYGCVICAMTALAIAAPVRRALRVAPAEALRSDP
jgi:ABC-type antimicrobial peptide transport system permease subunit